MTIAASRLLWDGCVCFVGIGLPSAACNLARLTHAPEIVLIYESGTIGARPEVLPLSIGDGELAATAACVVSLPDIFSHYLQAGRRYGHPLLARACAHAASTSRLDRKARLSRWPSTCSPIQARKLSRSRAIASQRWWKALSRS